MSSHNQEISIVQSISRWIPVFNDIATDPFAPVDLLVVEGEGVQQGYLHDFPSHKAKLQRFIYSEVIPHAYRLTAASVFEAVQKVASETFRWEIVYVDSENYTLQCIATTALFRFRDDFCCQVQSKGSTQGCAVHVRSRSRVGVTDLGANARRIRKFLAALADDLKEHS